MVGMRMRLMWLGSTGGIPEPLLFLSNINDSGEKVKCSISVSVRGNIHFCCRFLNILVARKPKFSCFRDFVPKRYDLCFEKVVRLDGCVAFSQIERKTPNLEWENVVVASSPNGIRKSRQCHFSHYEIDGFEGSESALFRKINDVLRFKA